MKRNEQGRVVNDYGVIIEVHDDKKGKSHINIYDKNPKEKDHKSTHINLDTKTGSGTIIQKDEDGKTITDTKCYLTTACMKHQLEDFDDNCYELFILRWFRDNFTTSSDINHYYKVAPQIVKCIDKDPNCDVIYNYIYESIIVPCVKAIKYGDFEFAYKRYKSSV